MLLFDMDGTLIDSNGVWKDVDREFLARRGLPYTHEYYEGEMARPGSSPRKGGGPCCCLTWTGR